MVELTEAHPQQVHHIEVITSSSLNGHLEALILETSTLKPGETPQAKWIQKPLENFTLVATDEHTGQIVKGKSDAKGRFRFSNLRPGQWKLTLELDSAWMKEQRLEVQPFPSSFELSPGAREHVQIQLKEKEKKWKTL